MENNDTVKTAMGKRKLEWTEKQMPVLEYERGDHEFVHPEYKKSASHYALAVFGVTLMGSQIGMTLGKIPSSYWPITVVAFIGGMASYIWTYFAMEHLPSRPIGVRNPKHAEGVEGNIPDETEENEPGIVDETAYSEEQETR